MPFTSIYRTNPRTNPWNFWELGELKNTVFFWVGHFDFFFASSPWKSVTNYVLLRMDGTQFLWLWWFTAKNDPHQTLIPAEYNRQWKITLFSTFPEKNARMWLLNWAGTEFQPYLIMQDLGQVIGQMPKIDGSRIK